MSDNRAFVEALLRLRELAQAWLSDCNQHHVPLTTVAGEATQAYKDLMFAFVFARLGATSDAGRLLQQVIAALTGRDEIHTILLQLFQSRIIHALEGKPHGDSLPPGLQQSLADMEHRAAQGTPDVRVQPWIVNRLREGSRILEPGDQIDSQRGWRQSVDELARALLDWHSIADPDDLRNELGRLMKTHSRPRDVFRILQNAFQERHRLGEGLLAELLQTLVSLQEALYTFRDIHELEQHAGLLKRAVATAADCKNPYVLDELVELSIRLLGNLSDKEHYPALAGLIDQCLRALRKLDRWETIDSLPIRMADLVMQGKDLAALRSGFTNLDQWTTFLGVLLPIAQAWLIALDWGHAYPILNETRELVLANDSPLAPFFHVRLVCRYATTLGQAPPREAVPLLEELFPKLRPLFDTFTTNSHYSLSQLKVIESVVLAVLDLADTAPRWS